jgi:cytochrome c553
MRALHETGADMKGRAVMFAGWVAIGLLAAVADASAEGDAKRGKVLAYTCHGCHGVPDYKNAFPNYSVPKLGGQNAAYLINALDAYAGGDRSHQTMHSQAATLSDQDRADIAAYLQSAVVQPNKQVIGTPPPAAQTCVACHGSDGAKVLGPDYPILAGQYADYLVHALQEYKSGKRKNPIMAGIIAGIDPKDFEALGQFFGRQQGLCGTDVLREQGKCVRDSE